MTPNSPASRFTLDHTAGRRRTGLLGIALVLALTVTWVVFAMPSSADLDPPGLCTQNQQQGKLCLTTVTDTPDPFAFSESSSIAYRAVLENQSSSSNLSHVALREELSAGTVISATSTVGTCSYSGQSATCTIGSLAPGATAIVDVEVTPPASGTNLITNTFTGSYDERFNDQNGGKVDTVGPYVESTGVWQALVNPGETGQVDTPAAPQSATTTITNPSTDVLASIGLLAPDNFCVKGTVKIGKKTYVCRSGGFVDLSVVEADDPSTHPNIPLITKLSWAASFVSAKQTKNNFVVFYRPDGSTATQVISERCDASASNKPCLRNISLFADGGASVELLKDGNGRMR